MSDLPDHFSPTSLLHYESCPASWAGHYIDGDRGDICYPFLRGSFIHRIFARYIKECADCRIDRDEALMERIVDEAFVAQRTVPMGEHADIMKMMLRAARRERIDWQALVDVEHPYWMDVGDYRFKGVPDVVYVRGNTAVIPDWKSGWVVPSQAEVDADFKMSCYAALIMDEENYPQIEIVTVKIGNLRYGITRDSARFAEHAAATKHEIALRIARIEADDEFKATPEPFTGTSYCGVCEFRGDCGALTHAIAGAGNKVPPIVDAEWAAHWLNQRKLHSMRAEQITKHLAEYVAFGGPIPYGDEKEYGPRATESTSYPPAAIVEACEGTDVDPWTLLRGDKKGVERAMRKNPPIAEALKPHAIVTAGTRTDLHTVKKEAPDDVA